MKNVYIERYIYEVVRRIPRKKRKQCEGELRNKILDMCEYDEKNVMNVLNKLGNPAEYAKRYNNSKALFVSNEHLEQYIKILKVIISCTITVAVILAFFKTINTDISNTILETKFYVDFFRTFFILFFEYAFSGCFFTVILLTIIFALIKYKKANKRNEEEWTAEKLSTILIPNSRNAVQINQCIIRMVVSIIVAGILIFTPDILGVCFYDGSVKTNFIPFLNYEYWTEIRNIAVCILLVEFVENLFKIISGVYTKKITFITIVFTTVEFILSFILFKVLPVFNPSFIKDVLKYKQGGTYYNVESATQWYTNTFPNIIMTIIVLCFIIKIGKTIYKSKNCKC